MTVWRFFVRHWGDGKEGDSVSPSPAGLKEHFVMRQRCDVSHPCPLKGMRFDDMIGHCLSGCSEDGKDRMFSSDMIK